MRDGPTLSPMPVFHRGMAREILSTGRGTSCITVKGIYKDFEARKAFAECEVPLSPDPLPNLQLHPLLSFLNLSA